MLRSLDFREGEGRQAGLAFAWFFALLASWSVLKPVRDTMAIAGGTERLPWLMTATFAGMLVASQLFGLVASRVARRRIVPVLHHALALSLVAFAALLAAQGEEPWIARTLFVWASVFNLLVVSAFWSVMADTFTLDQGRRLFGAIAAGGTAGALAGPAATALLVKAIGSFGLVLLAAVLLEACVVPMAMLHRRSLGCHPERFASLGRIGGSALGGIDLLLRSTYLVAICASTLCYNVTSTFLYLQQARLVQLAVSASADRARLFATQELAVNVLALVLQGLVTGPLLARAGVGIALALTPLVTAAGFLALGLAPRFALAVVPMLGIVVVFHVIRRAVHYAFERPARETLYTVVGPEVKYKAKSVIDTVAYRGGDAASGWLYASVDALAPGAGAPAFVAVPLAAPWLFVARFLARRQRLLAADEALGAEIPAPLATGARCSTRVRMFRLPARRRSSPTWQ